MKEKLNISCLCLLNPLVECDINTMGYNSQNTNSYYIGKGMGLRYMVGSIPSEKLMLMFTKKIRLNTYLINQITIEWILQHIHIMNTLKNEYDLIVTRI